MSIIPPYNHGHRDPPVSYCEAQHITIYITVLHHIIHHGHKHPFPSLVFYSEDQHITLYFTFIEVYI